MFLYHGSNQNHRSDSSQSALGKVVVTKNNDFGTHLRPHNRNEYTLKPSPRIYWRASLVPAAAVIPAPIAYINVVVVKKLVVGSRQIESGLLASITAL